MFSLINVNFLYAPGPELSTRGKKEAKDSALKKLVIYTFYASDLIQLPYFTDEKIGQRGGIIDQLYSEGLNPGFIFGSSRSKS